jgi:hypothetical protein
LYNLFGELARVHFPLLGQAHKRVTLVITVLRVSAWTHQNAGTIRIGQMRQRRFLKALLDLDLDHSDYLAG